MIDRLAQLEAQAAAIQNEIAQIRAGKAALPPQPPVRDEGVRVLQVLDERNDLPSLKEMERLFQIVKCLSPWSQCLSDRFDEHRPFRSFASSFRWLANVGRSEKPNGKVDLSFWLSTCRAWLRARNGVGSDLDANGFLLAVYASGDICYTPANPAIGHVWEIGVVEYGGRKASDAWRRILKDGASAILSPSAPARRMAPPSPARVFTGSGWRVR